MEGAIGWVLEMGDFRLVVPVANRMVRAVSSHFRFYRDSTLHGPIRSLQSLLSHARQDPFHFIPLSFALFHHSALQTFIYRYLIVLALLTPLHCVLDVVIVSK